VIWYAATLVLRLFGAAVVLLTWAYAVATYSPFAFEMFIRPQLWPWVNRFVAWHHAWYWAAMLGTVITLVPDLARAQPNSARMHAARLLAAGYVAIFGAVGFWLVTTPYIPTLWNDQRSLVVAFVSLVPLLWLAVLDHLAAPASNREVEGVHTGQWPLLVTCMSTALYLWLVHTASAIWRTSSTVGTLAWAATSTWALALTATIFSIVYVVSILATGLAASTRKPAAWARWWHIALAAVAIGEFLRRIVLAAISFDGRSGLAVAMWAGAVLALALSGLARRAPDRDEFQAGRVGARRGPRSAAIAAALVLLPLATFAAVKGVERFDWAFVVQKTVIVIEWIVAFVLIRRLSSRLPDRPWSVRMLVVPPLAAVAMLAAVPRMGAFLADRTGDQRADPIVALDWYSNVDPSFRLAASGLVEQAGLDLEYYRSLLRASAASGTGPGPYDAEVPAATSAPASPRPHIFVFVIDSLRPDYLSPYNPAVAFTPGIEQFAADSFVFRNVFTLYGGTWLAMPSIWAGREVTRRWGIGFPRINTFEQLIQTDGYRLVINDFTVAPYLQRSTPVTALDPGVPSVATDLCRLVGSLSEHLDRTADDARPVFAFLAPMNVHILNTRSGAEPAESGEYPGFFAPYASRLKRIDGCFSSFVSDLKRRGVYDNSIVILTSDHGDSLGERGYWGHQFFLFPEDVRLPLIVHLPPSLRSEVTADLARVTFSKDIAPTLSALLGHEVGDLGPRFGAPLFVPRHQSVQERRRAAFLLMSSYGPTYGVLRRNGSYLYISDLMSWREYGFELPEGEPLGRQVGISEADRRVNQAFILRQVIKPR
jgi:hypothetical protein